MNESALILSAFENRLRAIAYLV